MFVDIVFPNGNEKEFVKIAEKLGIKGLVFAYPYEKNLKKELKYDTKLKLYLGVLADHKTIHKARADIILVKSPSNDRAIFNKKAANIVFGLESGKREGFMHHRNSGLNQVLCKLANKNKIVIGISFSLIMESENPEKIMGRISQNIRFCRKYKVKTVLASFTDDPYMLRAEHDMQSLGIVLGMHPKEAKDSLLK